MKKRRVAWCAAGALSVLGLGLACAPANDIVLELGSTTSVASASRADAGGNVVDAVDLTRSRNAGPVVANAVIVATIDGDTVVVRIGATTEHLRLLGIDTPETHRPGVPIECFGPEASAFTAKLLPKGTRVRITRDVEARDRYGRLLGQLQRASDGLWIDEALVRAGMAAAKHYSPNLAGTDELESAQAEARASGRGLWGACGGPHEEAPV